MKLSKFKFTLPENLIAQHPSMQRDDARLMVVRRSDRSIEHRTFRDLLEIFNEGDVLILNDAKVFPARMFGNKEKTGARIEVFLLRELNNPLRLWDVLVDPARKIRVGNKLFFGDDELVAEVIDNTTSRGRTIRFLFDGTDEEFNKIISKLGETPLPEYITRPVEEGDQEWYQTIYAQTEGAIAPPKAGLHFTRELMMRMEIKGSEFAKINLNIGLGTSRPVEVEDLTKHKMDSESYFIAQSVADQVNRAKQAKKQVCAVGTSVLRAVESSVSAFGMLNPSQQWTDKFLFPPYEFKIPSSFITSFHQPESTLLMATAAFVGNMDFTKEIYKTAVKQGYRFLAYGDALLIL